MLSPGGDRQSFEELLVAGRLLLRFDFYRLALFQGLWLDFGLTAHHARLAGDVEIHQVSFGGFDGDVLLRDAAHNSAEVGRRQLLSAQPEREEAGAQYGKRAS